MSAPATLTEMLEAVRRLRSEIPEFNPRNGGNKEQINYYTDAIHALVLIIKQEVGFETYEQTLRFIDTELKMSA